MKRNNIDSRPDIEQGKVKLQRYSRPSTMKPALFLLGSKKLTFYFVYIIFYNNYNKIKE